MALIGCPRLESASAHSAWVNAIDKGHLNDLDVDAHIISYCQLSVWHSSLGSQASSAAAP